MEHKKLLTWHVMHDRCKGGNVNTSKVAFTILAIGDSLSFFFPHVVLCDLILFGVHGIAKSRKLCSVTQEILAITLYYTNDSDASPIIDNRSCFAATSHTYWYPNWSKRH